MDSRVIATLLLLGVVCVGYAAAEIPLDCCLSTTSKRVPLQIITDYRIQDAGRGCDIGATAFETKNGRILCVSHHTVEKWVRNYINHLKQKKAQQV